MIVYKTIPDNNIKRTSGQSKGDPTEGKLIHVGPPYKSRHINTTQVPNIENENKNPKEKKR